MGSSLPVVVHSKSGADHRPGRAISHGLVHWKDNRQCWAKSASTGKQRRRSAGRGSSEGRAAIHLKEGKGKTEMGRSIFIYFANASPLVLFAWNGEIKAQQHDYCKPWKIYIIDNRASRPFHQEKPSFARLADTARRSRKQPPSWPALRRICATGRAAGYIFHADEKYLILNAAHA